MPLPDRPVGYVAVRLSPYPRPRRPLPHSVGRPRNRVNSALARAAGGRLPVHWGDEAADMCMTRLRALAMECDALGQRAAAAGGDAVTTVENIALLEPGTGEHRVVSACSGEERPSVTNLMRKLQRAAQRSGLDARSQLTALTLVARDPPPENDETDAGEAAREMAG